MAFAHNLKLGIDLPIWQWLRFSPVMTSAGMCMCTDERGTGRYIYLLLGTAAFYRYDTVTDNYQLLASPGALGGSGTWGAGSCMVFDPSQGAAGRIWLLNGYTTQCGFGYYDIATNVWTARSITNLAAIINTDAAMAHTCSTYNVAGNDDFIYLISAGVSTTWYRYSIAGNSWVASPTSIANLPTAVSAGCSLHWTYATSPDILFLVNGGASGTLRKYTISTNSWTAALAYVPSSETFTTGTSAIYDPKRDRIWLQKDATHRILYYDLATDTMLVGPNIPYTSGMAHVGNGLVYIKTADEAEYLYYRRQVGTEFWRTLIFF